MYTVTMTEIVLESNAFDLKVRLLLFILLPKLLSRSHSGINNDKIGGKKTHS